MFRGIATINVYAGDLEAAIRWYSEVFGMEPYFNRPGYAEFRVGDHEMEFGIIDAAWLPAGMSREPGGAVAYWHVDDLESTFKRLIELGATEREPVIVRGEGFVTASVVDPFGNVLGIMTNEHYLGQVRA